LNRLRLDRYNNSHGINIEGITKIEIAQRDEEKYKGLVYKEYDRSKDVESGRTRGDIYKRG
jgi:hypothetical protein